jgi:hypothetical protein
MERSAYTPALFEAMKILSVKSDLVNPDKKFVCATTLRFEISNLYIIPFIYSKIISSVKKAGDYTADEINGMFAYFTNDIANKNIFFYEALDKGIIAESGEMEDYMKKNNFEFQSRVFGREFIYDDIIKIVVVRKYIDAICDNAQVTDNEIKEYYIANPEAGLIKKKAVVRQIRISYKGTSDLQKTSRRMVINDIALQLGNGADFSLLAKKYSDDAGTSNSGGLVGDYMEQGESCDVLDAVFFNMKPGEISNVTEFNGSFHIFKVEKVEDEKRKSLVEMKPEITKILLQNKKHQLLENEKKRLKNKYRLKFNLKAN